MTGDLIDLGKVRRQRQADAWAMPEPEVREHKGQRYTVTGSFERERRDGTTAIILQWTSHCADCGKAFTFTSPAASAKFAPNRRCQKHKRPGHRVKGDSHA